MERAVGRGPQERVGAPTRARASPPEGGRRAGTGRRQGAAEEGRGPNEGEGIPTRGWGAGRNGPSSGGRRKQGRQGGALPGRRRRHSGGGHEVLGRKEPCPREEGAVDRGEARRGAVRSRHRGEP